jgi:hypothetical protein
VVSYDPVENLAVIELTVELSILYERTIATMQNVCGVRKDGGRPVRDYWTRAAVLSIPSCSGYLRLICVVQDLYEDGHVHKFVADFPRSIWPGRKSCVHSDIIGIPSRYTTVSPTGVHTQNG